ncbi:MAG: serine/threonine protein kinase [Aristaeellaceae bacterium]
MTAFDPFSYCFFCMNRLAERNGTCPACGKDNHVRRNGDDELPFSYLADRKYTVGRALGRGGFGITYIGLNNRLGKRVAIKEFFPANMARRDQKSLALVPVSPEDGEQLVQGRDRVLNEARIIAQMEDIPNVVRIYDCFTRNNTAYIVMEYVEGRTLASWVEKQGPLPWDEAWRILQPIGQALSAMHDMGLVHRDVSPDNIMIRRDTGQSVLLDFGAASAMMLDGRKHAALMKEGYAPIEQYRENSIVDARTDEYSWAATFYYTLTACRPENAMQRSYNPQCTRPPRKLKAHISPSAEQALMKGMGVTQNERYATMDELLRGMAGGGKTSAGPRARRKRGGWLLAAGLAVGLVLVGAVAAGMVGAPSGDEAVGLVDGSVPLYPQPESEDAFYLSRNAYFSLVNVSEGQGTTLWYEVCLPVGGELKTCFLNAEDVQLLDEGSRLELLEHYRPYGGSR